MLIYIIYNIVYIWRIYNLNIYSQYRHNKFSRSLFHTAIFLHSPGRERSFSYYFSTNGVQDSSLSPALFPLSCLDWFLGDNIPFSNTQTTSFPLLETARHSCTVSGPYLWTWNITAINKIKLLESQPTCFRRVRIVIKCLPVCHSLRVISVAPIRRISVKFDIENFHENL